jgi:hypothetical protein
MKRRLILISFLIFCSGLFCPRWCGAASWPRVTDVTTEAFSVVWLTNKAATCSVNVYSDIQGNKPVTGFTTSNESAYRPAAAENGVMKVRVSGLGLGTTYYFQIVCDGGTLVEPASGPLRSVRTEDSSEYVDNDVLLHRILKSDGSTPALGALLVVSVQGADYPVTGWVGDYAPGPPWAQVNLMNIYSPEHHPLYLLGGEAITVESIGGLMGFRRLSATVPTPIPGGGMQTLSPEPSNQQCTLDAGPVIDATKLLPIPGGAVSESSPLISASYSDEYSAIALDSVRLYLDGVLVTTGVNVSSTGVEYRPVSPLSAGNHSATLWVSDEWGYETGPVTWSFTVPTAVVRYSTTAPTIGAVVVTLEPSEPITVTNNGGALSYTFTENGTFTFQFVDQAGKTGSATATVRWIVKPPRGLRIDRR